MLPRHEFHFDCPAGAGFASATLLATALLGSLNVDAATNRSPTGGGGTVVVEPVPAAAASGTWRRLVFPCRSPGLVVFSDRPCGPSPLLHQVSGQAPLAPQSNAGAVATLVPPAAPASVRPATFEAARAGPDEEMPRVATCRRLEEAVRALDDRMRAGYSAREAALLWSRWREAKERLREADC